jgi:hypothetical protein
VGRSAGRRARGRRAAAALSGAVQPKVMGLTMSAMKSSAERPRKSPATR